MGGGQGSESYAMTAYFYAYQCDLPKARNPIYLITGDEAFCEELYAEDLYDNFGATPKENISAKKVFADLLKKFKGNVFLIHRRYESTGSEGWTQGKILRQWDSVLSGERVIGLPEDLAIGDITLGVYAIVSGARTLKQYLEDMRTRPLDLAENVTYEPQSKERIKQVEEALQPLKDFKPVDARPKSVSVKEKVSKKKPDSEKKKPKENKADWQL